MKILSKKMISIILIITMLMAFVPNVSVFAAESAITLNITGGTATTKSAKAGDTFSVDVMLVNGRENQKAVSAVIEYDGSKLKLIPDRTDDDGNPILSKQGSLNSNISDGYIIGVPSTITENGVTKNIVSIAYLADFDPVATSGRLATLKFEVLEGFETSTTISVLSAKNSDKENDYEISGSNVITINPIITMTELKMNQESATLTRGATLPLTATRKPDNTTDTTAITWSSSNTGVVTVSNTGLVTAVGKGTADVIATCGTKTAKCTITVTVPLADLTMNQPTAILEKGATLDLTATKQPTDTDDTTEIVWSSSNPSVATVSNGLVTAVGNGTTTITATCGTETATCEIKVITTLVDITINEKEVKLLKNKEVQLSITKIPEDTTDETVVTWKSSNEAVATVDSNGLVKTISEGKATITATCGSFSKTCEIEVVNPLLAISINEGDQTLKVSQTKELTVTYNPEETTDSKAITWSSSDSTIAKVENGKVTALKPGEATITATGANNTTASIKVTVPVILATEVVITKNETTINKGKSETLIANILPEDTTETKVITWSSSDETIATVDENGKVTAIKVGQVTITATAEGLTPATCTVNVDSPLETISLNKTNLTLEAGEASEALTVILNPVDATVDVTKVVWESLNTEIATVVDGVVTAVAPGTATIRATLNGKEATCSVKVIVNLTGVEINNSDTDLELLKGQTSTLNVTYTPSNATEIPACTWSSSDEQVAIVDANGVVKALKEGTTTITVDYGNGISATRKVVVTEIPATGIMFVEKVEEMLKGNGNKIKLVVKALPENTTDDVVFTWSSSDETIATVDNEGNVVGLKAGKVIITATYNNFNIDMEIEIKEVPLTGIKVSSEKLSINEGEKTQIKVECIPENTTDDKTFKYESSNKSIATVDANGVVTGLKAGKVTITVISTVNPKATSSVEIEIKEKPVVVPDGSQPGSNVGGAVAGAVAQVATSTVTSPHTGDINIGLLISMLIISIFGIVYVIKKK